MLKMIITCRRNPAMSRPEFFDHLRNVHWPLIQQYPDVLAAVPGYVQNHSVLPEPGFELSAPYRIAAERDSVIELKFEGVAAIERLLSTPSYQQYVRPDEARFNDLPHNIMVLTEPSNVSRAPAIGRCKRFDFIRRAPDTEPSSFGAEIDRQHAVLARPATDGGFGKGAFDCVREVWAANFDSLSAVASRSRLRGVDEQTSFSVFATEFAMRGGGD